MTCEDFGGNFAGVLLDLTEKTPQLFSRQDFCWNVFDFTLVLFGVLASGW